MSGIALSAFDRYIGIDYSWAQTPTSSLQGPRVYLADGEWAPFEVPPPPSPRKYWTRRDIAEWPSERLFEDRPTLVGIRSPRGCAAPISTAASQISSIRP